MSPQTLRPLSIGEILDGAFTLYRRHFPTLFGVTLALSLPSIAMAFVDTDLASYVSVALSILIIGALTSLISKAVEGKSLLVGESLGVAVRRYFPLLAVFIAYCVLVGIGTVFLIVPGLILYGRLFAMLPVAILERNARQSIERSWTLTRGFFWRTAGVLIVSTLILMAPNGLLGGYAGVEAFNAKRNGTPAEQLFTNSPTYFFLGALVGALTSPFSMAVTVLLYYDLRVRGEGLDVQMAARALDNLPNPTPPPPPS